MKYIKISSNGTLDVRLISLMGGSTKRGDKFKIGKFGTGLKYTLAYLCRNNIDFKIFVGDKNIEVSTVRETIAGIEFEIIYVDGQRTSVTTQMGVEWGAWTIIREIWCNAMDEGGHSREVTETIGGEIGKTTFYIQLSTEIAEVLNKWEDYFIHDKQPMYDSEKFAIYSGGRDLCIYKHGVLIDRTENGHGLFSYDIKDADINELREYTGSLNFDIYKCLSQSDKKVAEYALQNMTEQHWEGMELDYSYGWTDWSEAWKEAIGTAKIIHQEAVNSIKARGLPVDLVGTVVVPKKLFRSLTKQFEGIGALRVANKMGEFYEIHDEKLKLRLKQALAILESCDYLISPELKFFFGVFGDKTTFAKVAIDKKEVYISEQMRDKSIFEFCTMLVEENGHFATGFPDCSRSFQQYWIDLFVKTMMEKHEVTL